LQKSDLEGLNVYPNIGRIEKELPGYLFCWCRRRI